MYFRTYGDDVGMGRNKRPGRGRAFYSSCTIYQMEDVCCKEELYSHRSPIFVCCITSAASLVPPWIPFRPGTPSYMLFGSPCSCHLSCFLEATVPVAFSSDIVFLSDGKRGVNIIVSFLWGDWCITHKSDALGIHCRFIVQFWSQVCYVLLRGRLYQKTIVFALDPVPTMIHKDH